MKTDIQIAQEAKMEHIRKVAERFGLTEEDLEFYGKYKAKISDQVWERVKNNPDGKLVLVTAINPTPAGEGKTTISIGLAQALNQMGKKTWLALREPSLGPCFGIKGGAAGGGPVRPVLRPCAQHGEAGRGQLLGGAVPRHQLYRPVGPAGRRQRGDEVRPGGYQRSEGPSGGD